MAAVTASAVRLPSQASLARSESIAVHPNAAAAGAADVPRSVLASAANLPALDAAASHAAIHRPEEHVASESAQDPVVTAQDAAGATPSGPRGRLGSGHSKDAEEYGTAEELAHLTPEERLLANRRIIAEDPTWNLAPITPLTTLALNVLLRHVATHPALHRMPTHFRAAFLAGLPLDLPLHLAARMIHDDAYWVARTKHAFPAGVPTALAQGAGRARFFELHVQRLIEAFDPMTDTVTALREQLKIAGPFLKSLHVTSIHVVPASVDVHGKPRIVPMGQVLELLPHLEELEIYYGPRDCGIDFDWSMFGLSLALAQELAQGFAHTPRLATLSLTRSKITDAVVQVLLDALQARATPLAALDLSHNQLGNAGGVAIARFLEATPSLAAVTLENNRVGAAGLRALAAALVARGTPLRRLSLRLNPVGDAGAAQFCLEAGALVHQWDLSACGLAAETVEQVAALIRRNLPQVTHLNLACNPLRGKTGGKAAATDGAASAASAATASAATSPSPTSTRKTTTTAAAATAATKDSEDVDLVGRILFEAMTKNKALLALDLRMTEISQEYQAAIQHVINENNGEHH
ncbi:hypothetical protein CXG81DRAFT_26767 [Caulochytrium protostelioides]|uniref:RNI-like protein n=1 Tax=Caulochytrium protostelioides TaxID=1555241 RepID=A0A4P9X5X1_9FUNG|nr:hypothetical protein CXG81DRAFT_26767 [Caulochytrium protostelioides]|eukprot:RKP00538.1 hypothetical protein CXG81DRAFT_26767 [Caulochytrium protostelioides]